MPKKRKSSPKSKNLLLFLLFILCLSIALLITIYQKRSPSSLSINQLDPGTLCQVKCCQDITITSTDPGCTPEQLTSKCDPYGGLPTNPNCHQVNPTPFPTSYPRSLSETLTTSHLKTAIAGQPYNHQSPIFFHLSVSPNTYDESIIRQTFENHTIDVTPDEPLPIGLNLHCPSFTRLYTTQDNYLRTCYLDGTPTQPGDYQIVLKVTTTNTATNQVRQTTYPIPLTISGSNPTPTPTATPKPTSTPTPTPTPTPSATPLPNQSPKIQTTTLPSGALKQVYRTSIVATDPDANGLKNQTRVFATGLPTGLSLTNCTYTYTAPTARTTCQITGQPKVTGKFPVTLVAVDYMGARASTTLSLVINRNAITPIDPQPTPLAE